MARSRSAAEAWRIAAIASTNAQKRSSPECLARRGGDELADRGIGGSGRDRPRRGLASSTVMSARSASARIDRTSRVRAATWIAVAAWRAKSDAIPMSSIVNGPARLSKTSRTPIVANAVLERHRQDRPRDIARSAPPPPGRTAGPAPDRTSRCSRRSRTHSRRHPGSAGSSGRRPAGPGRRPRRRTGGRRSLRRAARSRRPRRRRCRPSRPRSSAGASISTSVSRRTAVSARSATSRRSALAPASRSRSGVAAPRPLHHRARSAIRRTSTTTRSCGSSRRRPSETSSAMTRFTLWRVPPIIAASSDWV